VSIAALGGGGAAIAANTDGRHTPSPTPTVSFSRSPENPSPSPQSLTRDTVKAALLQPSDLAIIDNGLVPADLQPPASESCRNNSVGHYIGLLRVFQEGTTLILEEQVEIFRSSADAHTAFSEDASQIACTFPAGSSTSDISSLLNGLCDESTAVKAQYINSNNQVPISGYQGEVRCGPALISFSLGTPSGSPFDYESNFVKGTAIAVPKVRDIL